MRKTYKDINGWLALLIIFKDWGWLVLRQEKIVCHVFPTLRLF